MDRHQKTIRAMISVYCHGKHPTEQGLCSDCQLLQDYAEQRLENCPLQPNKPPCSKCTIHCYKPAMREKIREVMRYAGPRMLGKHPLMALRHLVESVKASRSQAGS